MAPQERYNLQSAISWNASGQMVRIKDYELFVKSSMHDGRPPLLLLHGFPTSSWDWVKMWPMLSDSFSLIAFDFLGFGYSSKPKRHNYTIHEQADLVEQVLATFDVKSTYVIAHDYAVSVMQEILARNNGLTKKVILLNGGLFPETHHARPIQKLLLGRWGRWVNKFLSKKSLGKNLKGIFGTDTQPSPEEIDAWWHLINYNDGKDIFYLLIRYMRDRIQHRERWLKGLQSNPDIIRLVNGPVDPISGAHLVARYQELVDDADCISLEGIGHYPNMEAPEEVSQQAISFFLS